MALRGLSHHQRITEMYNSRPASRDTVSPARRWDRHGRELARLDARPLRKCDADYRHAVVAGPARMVEDRSRVWPEDRETYYGAFVRNPDGNNVEAVCRLPE